MDELQQYSVNFQFVWEWSKFKNKQILYINAYMWNLEKWSHLQSRNRDTDVENKCIDTKEGRGRWDGLGGWD